MFKNHQLKTQNKTINQQMLYINQNIFKRKKKKKLYKNENKNSLHKKKNPLTLQLLVSMKIFLKRSLLLLKNWIIKLKIM